MRLPFDGIVRRRVYLMRHGDVAYFTADGQRTADSRLVVLTQQGREEAMLMRDLLHAVPLDRALCSGLPRTIETAAIVLGGRTLALEIEPDLEEIRGGTPEQRASLTLTEYAYAMFSSGRDGAQYAHGEAFSPFYTRIANAWTRILAGRKWTNALVAAHGVVNRAILCHVTGAGLSAFGAFEQDTGCLNVIDIDTDADGTVVRQIIRAVNVTRADPGKTGRILTTMEKLALQAFPQAAQPV